MPPSEFLEAFGAHVGVPAPTPEESDALLEPASLAAHGSALVAARRAAAPGGS